MSYSSVILADTPALYLKLDEGSGYTVVDSSGNGRNFSYAALPVFQIAGPLIAESPNYGARFTTATIDRAYRSYASWMIPSGNFTLECWVKFSSASATYELLFGIAGYLDSPNYASMVLFREGQKIRGRFQNTSLVEYTIESPDGQNDDTWKHVVLTYDSALGSNNLKLYINKAVVDQTNASGVVRGLGVAMSAGGASSAGAAKIIDYEGEMAHCAFYTTALSQTQINAHYDAAIPEIISPTTGALLFAGGVPLVSHFIAADHVSAWTRLIILDHFSAWRVLAPISGDHWSSWTVAAPYFIAADHSSAWTVQVGADHFSGWSVLESLELSADHFSGWSVLESLELSADHFSGWSVLESLELLAADHFSGWTAAQGLAADHLARWTVASPLAADHVCAWTVVDPSFIAADHRSRWTVIDLSPVLSVPSHFLRVGVELVPFVRARIRADEGSPYWHCEQLELQRASDYRKLPRDTPFSLNLFGVDYAFVVDTRELSRSIDADGNPFQVATITGLSPGCRHAGPRATAITRTWSEPASARAIVEELLGETVTWAMVEWWIPGGRLAVDGAYPLDIARRIVETPGGLLESMPDGSWLARKAWPRSVPDLRPDGPVDHALDDRTVFDVAERQSLEQRVNRVRIVDVEADYRDTLEWVADADDPLRGEMRAFPSPWREGLSIRHTRGTPPVYLDGELESASAEQTEVIEFKAGLANVRYPVLAVQSVTWLAESLGGVAAAGTQLTADNAGYSLAEVVYTTRYLRAPAHASEAAQAQFLLEDACLG